MTPIRIGSGGILTLPGDVDPDEARRILTQLRDAIRQRKIVVAGDGAQWHPFPPRHRIRLTDVERHLTR